MRVDVKTATTVEVGLEDMEKRIYLTLFMQIGLKTGAEVDSTCNKDVDTMFS
jgi:hypothetical protein